MGKSNCRPWSRSWAAWLCGVVIVGTTLSGASPAAASPTVPGAPIITSATSGLHSVTIAFRPTSNGGVRISNYRVACTSGNGGVANSHSGFGSPIDVTGLTAGKTYACTVTAKNRIGTSPASPPSLPTVALPTVPAPPTITSMTSGLHKVTVGFKTTSDGGARILNYRVTCTIYYSTRTHQAFTSPITIACAQGAEVYTCSVAAENRFGWSHSSPTANGVSLPLIPGAPTITATTAGMSSVTVAFASPANDGGVRILNYRVTCTSTNGGVTNSHQAFASPISVGGLSASKTYTCTVAAINQVASGPTSTPSPPIIPFSG